MRAPSLRSLLLAGATLALIGAGAVAYGQGYGPGPGWGMGQGGGPCWGGQGGGPGWGMGQGMMGQGGGPGWGPGQGRGMMGQGMGPGWQGGEPPFMQRFAAIDVNQDGSVSAEETAEQADAVFASMDADGDDQVTLEEFLAVDMGMGPSVNRPGMAQRRQARREARYKSFDADGDGTHEEFLAVHQKQFASADRNGDGRTDPFEFRMMQRGF
jgi:hypothetical protein